MDGVDNCNVMSLELLSGILIWGGAGWLLDRWLSSGQWFFGFGVMLGFAAGLYLVWLRSGRPVTPPTSTTAGRDPVRGGR